MARPGAVREDLGHFRRRRGQRRHYPRADEIALVEHALPKCDAALMNPAALERRHGGQIEPGEDVRLTTVAVRERNRVAHRKVQRDDRWLQVVESADLITAAAWQVWIGRRVRAERPVEAVVPEVEPIVPVAG